VHVRLVTSSAQPYRDGCRLLLHRGEPARTLSARGAQVALKNPASGAGQTRDRFETYPLNEELT